MTCEATLYGKNELDIHLDSEFVFLAQFIRFSKNRVSCEDEPRCVAWLQKLLCPTRNGTTRIVRNTYLAELLLAMQSGHLCGPFANEPTEGALSLSELQPAEFKEVREPAWLDTVINTPVSEDGYEGDERTYIATQTHPDGQAAYAYLAVSTTDHDHWLDPHADSDNESALNLTPPESDAPTTCGSCASVNPIPEAIKLPCAQDQPRCRTRNATSLRATADETIRCTDDPNPLIHFYNELLALVDCVQRTGVCSDNAYIAQLLRRMKEQATDPTLLEMSSQQLHLELLRRLRAKLLTRREQAKRMIASSPQRVPSEGIPDCPADLDLSLDDELWESAASRELSSTNITLLASVYPPALVSRFVSALIRERCALIARLRAEHEVLVTSLRSDIQRDIEESLDRFREARALWVLLLRATQEMQYIKTHELMNTSEPEKGLVVRETVREIRDAMVALDEEGKRGASLANQLVSEHQDLAITEREAERRAQRLLAHNDALRMSLQTVQAQEAAQLRRINELQQKLELTAQFRT